MSKQWGVRPSDLYDISDRLAALYFDKAVFAFGRAVEMDIEKATENAKNNKAAQKSAEKVLRKWLDDGSAPVQRFREPPAVSTGR